MDENWCKSDEFGRIREEVGKIMWKMSKIIRKLNKSELNGFKFSGKLLKLDESVDLDAAGSKWKHSRQYDKDTVATGSPIDDKLTWNEQNRWCFSDWIIQFWM